jgi:hypothetical protein
MSNFWNNQASLPGTEISATMTGSAILIGTLPVNPCKLILDNQGTASVALYINGTNAANLWHTFPAGEAMILDQDLTAFPKGTSFYGNGASGFFSISYTYNKT